MTNMQDSKDETTSTETVEIVMETQKNPDPVTSQTKSKYAWVLLLASFLTQFFNPSVAYAVGVFHLALLERFPDEVTITEWLGALYGSMFALGGPVASLVCNTFDCRTCVFASGILGLMGYCVSGFVMDVRALFLPYAVIAGFGNAFAQVGSMVVLGYYFPQDTAVVSGIAICGAGLGIFVHPPLLQLCIDWYGLTGTFLLVGAMAFQCCIFGLLMRPSQHETSRKTKLRSGRTRNETIMMSLLGGAVGNKRVFLKFSFWMFLLSTLLLAMAYAVHLLLLPDYMEKEHNTSRQEASVVISFIGVGSLISRVCVGALGNDKRVGPEITYFSLIGITSIISLFLPLFAQGTGGRFAYGLLLGLYTGGVFSLESAIVLKITGVENFALAYGAVLLFVGLGSLMGPPIGGLIYKTSSYSYVFLSSSVMFFLSTFSGIMVPLGRSSHDSDVKIAENESHETRAELMSLSSET